MIDYFFDPVLRGPTIGSMFMCLGASLVGVIVFLRKESLLGETLSHAAYPGVVIGSVFLGIGGIIGAFFSAILGLLSVRFLKQRCHVKSDASLCFVLAAFFGFGVTLVSRIQFLYPSLYRQSLVYLYGQVATMVDFHIYLYGVLSAVIIGVIVLFYKEILATTFDRVFVKTSGLSLFWVDVVVYILVALAVVVGIRSVGVVLISAMLIAPAASARCFTHNLSTMFVLAGFFGLVSGFFGTYLSVELTDYAFPTGPMIVLVASSLCFLSILVAPQRGLLMRFWRIGIFHYQCSAENILKAIWRISPEKVVTYNQIAERKCTPPWLLHFILFRLVRNGWLEKGYILSSKGRARAAHIVRLHRLWEVYLADYLGVGAERVHPSAEEMEHILTPEIELELVRMLHDPKLDPHHQPIPEARQ